MKKPNKQAMPRGRKRKMEKRLQHARDAVKDKSARQARERINTAFQHVASGGSAGNRAMLARQAERDQQVKWEQSRRGRISKSARGLISRIKQRISK